MPVDKKESKLFSKALQNVRGCCPSPLLWSFYPQPPHQSDGCSAPDNAGWPRRCSWSEWPPSPSELWLAAAAPPCVSLKDFWKMDRGTVSNYSVRTVERTMLEASAQEWCVYAQYNKVDRFTWWFSPRGVFLSGLTGCQKVPCCPSPDCWSSGAGHPAHAAGAQRLLPAAAALTPA